MRILLLFCGILFVGTIYGQTQHPKFVGVEIAENGDLLLATVNAHLFRSIDGGMNYGRIPSPEEQGVFSSELNDGLINVVSRAVSTRNEIFVMQGFLWYRSKASPIKWELLPKLKDVAYNDADKTVWLAYANKLEVRSSMSGVLVAEFLGLPDLEWGQLRIRKNVGYVVERNGKLYMFDLASKTVTSCVLNKEARLMMAVTSVEDDQPLPDEQEQTKMKNELIREILLPFAADSIVQIRFSSSYAASQPVPSLYLLYTQAHPRN